MTDHRTPDPTEEQIRDLLNHRDPLRIDPEGYKIAAVLVPIFKKDGAWHVLLTRRTDTVEHHKGEISFPGGHRDPEDPTHQHTALREAHEEVGIAPDQVAVLGRLDDIITVTGFRVRPFVGVIPYPIDLCPSPYEIAEVITLPLADFMETGRLECKYLDLNGQPFPVYFFHVGGTVVWGATAKILKQFLERCFGFH